MTRRELMALLATTLGVASAGLLPAGASPLATTEFYRPSKPLRFPGVKVGDVVQFDTDPGYFYEVVAVYGPDHFGVRMTEWSRMEMVASLGFPVRWVCEARQCGRYTTSGRRFCSVHSGMTSSIVGHVRDGHRWIETKA